MTAPLSADYAMMLHPGRRLAFWLLLPFVALQGLRVRRRAPRFAAAEGPLQGRTGQGNPLRLLAIGDSIIAGVGAKTIEAALTGQMAQALANRLDRAIHGCPPARA